MMVVMVVVLLVVELIVAMKETTMLVVLKNLGSNNRKESKMAVSWQWKVVVRGVQRTGGLYGLPARAPLFLPPPPSPSEALPFPSEALLFLFDARIPKGLGPPPFYFCLKPLN